MQPFMNFNILHPFHSIMLGLRRKRALRRLSEVLSIETDEELEDLLEEVGIQRKNLFTSFDGNAPHRRRMGRMLVHFGVDRAQASLHHWGDLVHAERRCARCRGADRCQRWLDAHHTNIAPNVFCPNAAQFEYIRSAQVRLAAAKARIHPHAPDSPDSSAARVEAAWNAVQGREGKPFWRQ